MCSKEIIPANVMIPSSEGMSACNEHGSGGSGKKAIIPMGSPRPDAFSREREKSKELLCAQRAQGYHERRGERAHDTNHIVAHPGRRGGMQQSLHFAVTAGDEASDEASTRVMQKDQAVGVHIRRSGFAEMQSKNRPHDPHDQEHSLQTGRAQGTPYGHHEDG